MAGVYVFLTYSYNRRGYEWTINAGVVSRQSLPQLAKGVRFFCEYRKKSVFLQQIKPEAWK